MPRYFVGMMVEAEGRRPGKLWTWKARGCGNRRALASGGPQPCLLRGRGRGMAGGGQGDRTAQVTGTRTETNNERKRKVT